MLAKEVRVMQLDSCVDDLESLCLSFPTYKVETVMITRVLASECC